MIVAAMLTAMSDEAIIYMARIKVLLVFFQILGSISFSFPAVKLPPAMASLNRKVAVVGLDIGVFLAQTCVGDFDFLHTLQAMTIGPLAVTFVLFGSYFAYGCLRTRSQEDLMTFKRMVYNLFLLLTYCIFTTCSTVVIRALQCDSDFRDSVASRVARVVPCHVSPWESLE